MSLIKSLKEYSNIYNRIKDRIINKGVIILEPDTVRLSFDTIVKRGVTIEPFVFIKRGVIIKAKVIIIPHPKYKSSNTKIIKKANSIVTSSKKEIKMSREYLYKNL